MENLTAVATTYGLGILSSSLKNKARTYALIGADNHSKPERSTGIFYQETIDSSYFDDYGVLTFIIDIPSNVDFNKYLYSIVILDDTEQVIVKAYTPQVALSMGIGGTITLKAAVTGEAGEIIFKAHDYITGTELTELWMNPIYANTSAITQNSTRQVKQYHRTLTLADKQDEQHNQNLNKIKVLTNKSKNIDVNKANIESNLSAIYANTSAMVKNSTRQVNQHNRIVAIEKQLANA